MTDKKFTDEEIKSSLEVIATTRNCNECKIRNCKWGTCNCSQITANVALGLINRQKAENDCAKAKINKLEKARQKQAYLLCNLKGQKYELMNRISAVKNEAYKEFAERLKSYLLLNEKGKISVITFEDVEKLLKELVGENK